MSQDSFDAGESDGDGNDDDDNSQISQTEVSEEGAMTSTPKSTKLPLKHRQKSQKRKRDDEEFRVIQGLAKSISERNESKKAKISGVCASYGTYVGETLEKLDARTRCIAQHQISNVLFQAQMGTLFQQPQPQIHSSNADKKYSSAVGLVSWRRAADPLVCAGL
ncbi:hypothetical protein LSAT2_020783 [Lamellibrachia satsuma]|nr:hypothetical protein LSAT2_020783 [Lamellibrachia satsuma]